MIPGQFLISPPHVVDEADMVEFAKRWDPLPIHTDKNVGVKVFGSLTAPGLYMLAVKQLLIHQLAPLSVIASFGYDELRFHHPLRPNDVVRLRLDWINRRQSNSKPDQGIVTLKLSLINQEEQTVMSHLDTILVKLGVAKSE